MHSIPLNVISVSSVRDRPRLAIISDSGPDLQAAEWTIGARTDDDLSLEVIVNHSRQNIASIEGISLSEDDHHVYLTVWVRRLPPRRARTLHSLTGKHMVDLSGPLAGRTVVNPPTDP
ncbi:hypothetical protein [Amycolatopsis echigonensis]|uniref:Uncharacterized protein n=1 Tax=Amycolatopsis echigonensis TaxID=2576905 RepID=A0A2N3WMZ7_9PSEU|nr:MULTISPECIES: hypothetical protein [Amycolatopsis]MBB2506103.1 hypothetical protein [Amycolatopsis echigonensis]PKV95246.1 hypothetical protein ATK30_6156 [Amycolatopsis niigatensis]